MIDFKKLKNIFLKFNSLSYSGAYRLYILYLANLSSDSDKVADFSHAYILLMFFTSFVGFPCAAMLIEKNSDKNIFYLVLLTLFLSFISLTFFGLFTNENLLDSFVVSSSFFLSSLFEVLRQVLINRNKYYSIFISSIFSFFSITFFYFEFFKEELTYFLLVSMFLLVFSSIIALRFDIIKDNYEFDLKVFFSNFFNNSLSSLTSTSVNYFMPLLVISVIGQNSAPSFAFLSSALGFVLLLPRYLSNEFIQNVRSGVPIGLLFERFFVINSFLILCVLMISVIFIYFLSDIYSLYLILFSAGLICSQFCLPYSNVFSVFGKSAILMKINLISFIILLFSIGFIYILDAFNAVYILLFYVVDQFLKLYLSSRFYNKMNTQAFL